MAEQDVFRSAAAYEPYVGRWSRRIAPEFVAWLEVPRGSRWLDVGCGTGALTASILDTASPSAVTGVDPSAAFVDHARATIGDSRCSFEVGDAMALPFPDAAFDSAAAALVLNFVPDPARGVAEMRRAVAPGGTAGAYVWDYADGMAMMRVFWDAAVELDPAAAALDEGARFPICRRGALAGAFSAAGFEEVGERELVVDMRFRDFDDYWGPFLGGQAPAPAYAMSLDEAARAELRELIRSKLPAAGDGSIELRSRAWAARGRVPAGR